MKKLIPIIIVVIIVAVAAVVLASRKSGDKTTPAANTTPSTSQSTSSSDQPAASQPVATSTVTIKDMAFSPANITVKKGTSVTWTNQDNIAHTVTADSGNGPDSGTLANGKSYSFTFNSAGTFTYHCNFHGNMTGTVVVTE